MSAAWRGRRDGETKIAFGESRIQTDSIVFRHEDEVLEFKCEEVLPHLARYNGYFYEADLESLKALQEKKNRCLTNTPQATKSS